jgi:hypothetical protein
LGEQIFDAGRYHIQGYFIVTTFRDDHIGVAFARLDKLQVHRADGAKVLLYHGFGGSSALCDVASQTPDESNIRIGVDV